MMSSDTETLVFDFLLSSVVPASVTGEGIPHEFTNMDLVMKLHYLRGVYFFSSEAAQGLHICDLKDPMFKWLELYYPTAGRIRRWPENGRPFIKCNDSGVRIVEAKCSKTLNEWLTLNNDHSPMDHLTYNSVLGPDLSFTPLLFIQLTWFKCGGLSVGLRWAHILGDAFSASSFLNAWGQIMKAGELPPESPNILSNGKFHFLTSIAEKKPLSVKLIDDPIGDHWIATSNCKMETFSLHFTAKQLNNLLSKIANDDQIQPFEILCGIMWKSFAKVKEETGPSTVTICRNDSRKRGSELLKNSLVIGTVQAEFSVAKAHVLELAKLIGKRMVDETSMIQELMEKHNGNADFTVYGTNLTFVNLEELKIYDLEIKGQKAIYANYGIDGVGDEGAVLVLPGPENGKDGLGCGRTVTVVLSEHRLKEFKIELKREWGKYLIPIEAMLGFS